MRPIDWGRISFVYTQNPESIEQDTKIIGESSATKHPPKVWRRARDVASYVSAMGGAVYSRADVRARVAHGESVA